MFALTNFVTVQHALNSLCDTGILVAAGSETDNTQAVRGVIQPRNALSHPAVHALIVADTFVLKDTLAKRVYYRKCMHGWVCKRVFLSWLQSARHPLIIIHILFDASQAGLRCGHAY